MSNQILHEQIKFSNETLDEYAIRFGDLVGDKSATEDTYYPAFNLFLEDYFSPQKNFKIQVNRIEGGLRPDFTIFFNQLKIMLIEAKTPDTNIVELLEPEKENRLKNQIINYRKKYGYKIPLLITNFTHLYALEIPQNEESVNNIEIKRSICILKNQRSKWVFSHDSIPQIETLFSESLNDISISIDNINGMINQLAIHAQELKDRLLKVFDGENGTFTNKSNRIMMDLFKPFKNDLDNTIFSDYKEDKNILFADLVAQTITYSCFGAWIKFCYDGNNPETFTINKVGENLPYTSFLRHFFLNMLTKLTPSILKENINKIEKVFQSTKYNKLVIDPENIFTMFYSEFLKKYDKETSKARGVIYTPNQIVDYMIKGIDFFLINKFGKSGGIIDDAQSDENKMIVNFLEPAAGTMAFPCRLLKLAKTKFEIELKNQSIVLSTFREWINNFFFENVFAFEILVAPYVLGQIRTFISIQDLLYNKIEKTTQEVSLPDVQKQMKYYLMNTLMNSENIDSALDSNLKNTLKKAINIRNNREIYVIFGNPPYNVSTQNDSHWIRTLIEDYKENLEKKDRKNLKILSDDYVKFIRFAQWKIHKTGKGMVAFITNNNYLDGSVFKGMRASLIQTFNEIYVVNLHGNMRKNESGNPFGVKVGVAIVFLLRTDENYGKNIGNSKSQKISRTDKNQRKLIDYDSKLVEEIEYKDPLEKLNYQIFYKDISQNKLADKYWELSKPISMLDFQKIEKTRDLYFVPIDSEMERKYQSFPSIIDLFKINPKSGIMSGRDALVINPDSKILQENIKLFFEKNFKQLEELGVKVKDTNNWSSKRALKHSNKKTSEKAISKFNYRGFDKQNIIYDNTLVEGCRLGYLDIISDENPAIGVTRSIRSDKFSHSLIINTPAEKCFLAVKDSSYIFPLKINDEYNVKKPDLGFKISHESVFYYIYAVLYSSVYRLRYIDQLKNHYPHIPFPSGNIKWIKEKFINLSDLGRKLANIHLLEDVSINDFPTNSNTDYKIIKPYYSEDEKRIYLASSGFWIGEIDQNIWDFEIGGILQIKQWLKSRVYKDPKIKNRKNKRHKGLFRGLNSMEMTELLKICSAIKKTLELVPKIDKIFSEIDPPDS